MNMFFVDFTLISSWYKRRWCYVSLYFFLTCMFTPSSYAARNLVSKYKRQIRGSLSTSASPLTRTHTHTHIHTQQAHKHVIVACCVLKWN